MFKAWYHRQNFNPGLLSLVVNPFFFIRRALRRHLEAFAPELQGRILDFGCGAKPYRDLFAHAEAYVGVDMENPGHDHGTEDIDVYYDGKILPFEDASFDGVFSSEVFEHVPEPELSLMELRRVLKPKGRVLLTVPMVWNEHELPHDHRRFTAPGLVHLMERLGFRCLRIEKSGHFALVIAQLRILYLRNLIYTKNRFVNLGLNAVFVFPFTLLLWIFSSIVPRDRSLYFNVVALFEKVES